MTHSAGGGRPLTQFERLIFRYGTSIVCLFILFLMAAIYCWGDRDLYYATLKWWGIIPYRYPFVDMKIVLTAIDCSRYAIDIYSPNTCMYGGWYSYSPILLGATKLPLGPDYHSWVGLFFGVAFLAALSVLPPSMSWKEFWIRTLATLSTVTVFALERTEFDVPIFLIVVTGVVLSLRPTGVRFLGYAIFVFAALLKYYPLVLMLLVARERFRTAVWIALATIAAVCSFILATTYETLQIVGLAPVGSPFADYFGARNLPLGITLIEVGRLPLTDDAKFRMPLSALGQIALGILLVYTAWTAARSFRADSRQAAELPPAHLAFLVAGGALMVGCFFAVQNAGPRAIFLLMALPGLFAMASAAEGRSARRPMALICGVLFLLWEGFFYGIEEALSHHVPPMVPLHFLYWIAREMVWWWVMARLAGLVIAFLWNSPALAPALDLLRIPRPERSPVTG